MWVVTSKGSLLLSKAHFSVDLWVEPQMSFRANKLYRDY